MPKSIEYLSEEEINDIFKIIGILRENGNVFYEVKNKTENRLVLKNKKGEEILITNKGIYEKPFPYKKHFPLGESFPVARYLIEKGYDIGQN